MKKIIGTATLVVMLLSGQTIAWAQETPNVQQFILDGVTGISINGQSIDTANYQLKDGSIMVPIRVIGEAMGYKVQWIADGDQVQLAKDNQVIEIDTNENGYRYEGQPAIALNQGAYLKNYTTYVSAEFLKDFLSCQYQQMADGRLNITTADVQTQPVINGTVQSVREDGSILVCGTGNIYNEIVLQIDENTGIWDQNGQQIGAKSLIEGTEVAAVYYSNVTKSLPPQGLAKEIRMTKQEKTLTGVIEAIDDQEWLLTEVSGSFTKKVKLILPKEVVITDAKGNMITVDQVSVGTKIKVNHDGIATFSLPPKTTAISVEVIE